MAAAAPPPRRVAHASGLRAAARELTAMHAQMLRGDGSEALPARLSALNLVAACVEPASLAGADATITAIAEHHPLRVITVLARPDEPASIEADLDLRCSVTRGAQVCAEHVHLTVGGEPALHLASVLTPLLVADTPVILWLVGAPPVRQALSTDAVAICERLLLDSGAYEDAAATLTELATELAGPAEALEVADLAWERTRDWRALLASCFDGEETRGFQRGIDRLEVDCSGAAASTQGWLLAGWLSSRLSWAAPPEMVVGGGRGVEAEDGDLVGVRLHCARDAETATVTCERQGDALTASIEVSGGPRLERAVPFRPPATVDTVTRLLREGPSGRLWHDALLGAARLLGARA
ncbi:MAG: glucose-6-phosphate dehydrogenase assembly protein OpcA [Candidatus Dormibacteria bacterium]